MFMFMLMLMLVFMFVFVFMCMFMFMFMFMFVFMFMFMFMLSHVISPMPNTLCASGDTPLFSLRIFLSLSLTTTSRTLIN